MLRKRTSRRQSTSPTRVSCGGVVADIRLLVGKAKYVGCGKCGASAR